MGLITKLFGTRSEREIKRLMPQAERSEALASGESWSRNARP